MIASLQNTSILEFQKRFPLFEPIHFYRIMVKTRVMEERLIKMSKSSDGYFWIGGPGEEAFNTALGLHVRKGEGIAYDYLHMHYRNSATLVAMGMEMIDAIRQMASSAQDPFSGGRNFISHYAVKKWNVMPITSPIETQYSIAPGTAWAQKKSPHDSITVVTGGDAGSAEGDFATCLNFSSRPGMELPILIIVTNNKYGISTPSSEVHGDQIIARRAHAFGIKWSTVNGNDPLSSFQKLTEIFEYIRKDRKPYCLEASVSRLHGHSSSSGGQRVSEEVDCIQEYEEKLLQEGILTKDNCSSIRRVYEEEALESLKLVRLESKPASHTIYDHIFA